jgi:hypothetical protein
VPYSYSVYARDEEFLVIDGRYFRRNELWRSVIDRRTGNRVGEERLKRNFALVTYTPEPFRTAADPAPVGPLGEQIPQREPRWRGRGRPDAG